MKLILMLLFSVSTTMVLAQDSTETEKKKSFFKKENLFTGGGITLSFSSEGSVMGASPVFGYSINKWIDAGVVLNFIYGTTRHVIYQDQYGTLYRSDDKLRQTIIGPGAFVKVYPFPFIFLQAQGEKNFIKRRFMYDDPNYADETEKLSASSFLVGGGYCNGREGKGDLFYYVSILFDVAKNKNSPYVEETLNGNVNVLPIIRAGLQIPLFQGRKLL